MLMTEYFVKLSGMQHTSHGDRRCRIHFRSCYSAVNKRKETQVFEERQRLRSEYNYLFRLRMSFCLFVCVLYFMHLVTRVHFDTLHLIFSVNTAALGPFCYVHLCELSCMCRGRDIKLHPHRVKLYRMGCVGSGLVLAKALT